MRLRGKIIQDTKILIKMLYSYKIGDIIVVKNLDKVLLNTIDKNLIL